jgi:hypothetical protein
MAQAKRITTTSLVPIHQLDEAGALNWLRQVGRTEVESIAALGKSWGWERSRTSKAVIRWERAGHIVREPGTGGNVVIRVLGTLPAVIPAGVPAVHAPVLAPTVEQPAWRRVEHPAGKPGVTASPSWWNAAWWNAAGRAAVGLAIVATAAWVAYNSMRGNAWFGHSLTPDPVAGDIYAQLSVAAEVLACLVPTGIRFYRQNGERWTALRGWVLMAVVLTVMFFAAGGFALTNINAGVEVRAERETQEVQDLRNRIATLTASIGMPGPDGVIIKGECAKRGDKCRELEVQRTEANAKLETARNDLKGSADPQAAALHLSSTNLRLIEAGAMVALCLAAGMFISFGAGLIWPAAASAKR